MISGKHFRLLMGLLLTCSMAFSPMISLAGDEPVTPELEEPASQLEQPMNPMAGQPNMLMGSVFESHYVIGAGDMIYLEDANMGMLVSGGRILPDGSINLPLVGKVYLSGLSVPQAKDRLTEKYGKFYVDPKMTLQVTNQRPVRVYVMGAVASPGVYISGKNLEAANLEKATLGNYDTLSWYYRLYLADALILAGGLSHNANVKDIRIKRVFPSPMTIHVNLMDLLANGNTIHDIPLRDQDVIEVDALPDNAIVMDAAWEEFAETNFNQGTIKVSVLGAVTKPGVLTLEAKDNVLTAIAQSGGFTDMADKDKIYILRATTTGQMVKRELNLKDRRMIGKKPIQEWAALLPDDVIFVDESEQKKMARFGMSMLDKATSAAIFPFMNNLVKEKPKKAKATATTP